MDLVMADLTDVLWKATISDGSMFQKWVRRQFTISPRELKFYYISKDEKQENIPINRGCLIQQIAGKYMGREYCLRVLWPDGRDLILGADNKLKMLLWKQGLYETVFPNDAALELKRLRTEAQRRRSSVGGGVVQNKIDNMFTKFKNRKVVHRPDISIKSSSIFYEYEAKMPLILKKVGKAETVKKNIHKNQEANSSEVTFRETDDEFYAVAPNTVGERRKFSNMGGRGGGGAKGRRNSVQMREDEEERKYSIGYPIPKDPKKDMVNQQYIPPEHQAVWTEFRKAFPDRAQEELKRFLVSKNWDLAKASVQLIAHKAWRDKMFPINPTRCMDELAKGKCFVHGYDRAGHPIIYYFTRKQDPATRNLDQVIDMLVYRFEQALVQLPGRDGKVTVLFIREGSTNDNFDLELMRHCSKIFQDNYPERLYSCIVWPMGWAFRYLWAFASLFLDKATKKKVIPIASRRDLLKTIAPEVLIKELGGDNAFSFESEAKLSPILYPKLWTNPQLSEDYYPPQVASPTRMDSTRNAKVKARTRRETKAVLDSVNILESSI